MKTESSLLYFKAAGLCVFLIFSLVFSMLAGTEKIPAGDFFPALINYNPEDIYSVILFKIRLPRTLTAAVCGLLLGGTGAILQGFFRNPLADSGVLGLSSGAALGGVIGSTLISTSFGQYTLGGISTISLSAFAGALFCAIILLFFSRSGRKGNGTTLILAGTALSAIFTGLTSYILLLKLCLLSNSYVPLLSEELVVYFSDGIASYQSEPTYLIAAVESGIEQTKSLMKRHFVPLF